MCVCCGDTNQQPLSLKTSTLLGACAPWGRWAARYSEGLSSLLQKKFYGPQRRKMMFMGFVRLGVWSNFFRARSGGFSGNLEGEGFILGGVFVVGSGKQVMSGSVGVGVCGPEAPMGATFPTQPPRKPAMRKGKGKGEELPFIIDLTPHSSQAREWPLGPEPGVVRLRALEGVRWVSAPCQTFRSLEPWCFPCTRGQCPQRPGGRRAGRA